MPTLRSLIIKEWFKFFLGAFLGLLLLITVAELITGFLRQNVTPLEVILNHLLEIPDKFKLIMPVSCLMASLFSINKLRNRNELTAIFAAGYSRKKFFNDIASAAIFVAAFQFSVSGFIEPYAISKKDFLIEDGQSKFKNLRSKGLMASTIGSGKMWFKSNDYFFSFSTFDDKKNTLSDVSIYFFKDNKLAKKISTPLIQFMNNIWVAKKSSMTTLLDGAGYPTFKEEENITIPIFEDPSDFSEIEADITTLNFFELYHYITRLKAGGINVDEYSVMLYEKLSTCFVCIIFALVASIGVFSPNRRGNSFAKSIGGVFAFVILYWLINSYFIELGKSSKISPFLSCFGVPLLFSIYLLYNFYKNRSLK
ncbi:MAG: hypothetical protein CME63_18110 [Halobacteriovoraceae bacterium]|nr:hypothetical protein [Halobacteriovoraceae bacterium]|tara:strand:- start:1148 stop:2248 length:1101 start_codon:yes stop_codon:yes gene_type:complete